MILYKKLKKKSWSIIVSRLSKKQFYPKIYKSYWYLNFNKTKKDKLTKNYYAAIPNPGAGIGHQMANWIAGYWFAKKFELEFAHIPFSSKKWESFLGFGANEIKVSELVNNQGYKKIKLPLFDENNPQAIELTKKIIEAYNDKKVVFIAEQDQFYKGQIGVIKDLKPKFHNAEARKTTQLVYNQDNFNIAIHVRRGDITIGQESKNTNLLMRWQDNDYFKNVLLSVTNTIKTQKPIAIYLFSQGNKKDFQEFNEFKNLTFCLDMNAQDSFEHMAYADLLITSKSSFSYKPALLSNGIKVCPQNFWHDYPKSNDWILVDDNGVFDINKLLFIN
ncbi:hypothetical protein [Algibacter lectus]|uniref:hypothetical protein n=1 Tax=Algibacter lectus TaxID=221126 RepID=UPI0026F1E6BA|nr:hypothetical protein [Algibacter lectus]MDO7138871.1 hypothetical protein [Algibacter lectus]